jgi:protein-L-isoaspartate(D-aspartate) O-methyltransferase
MKALDLIRLLAESGVHDESVLSAIENVPRDRFCLEEDVEDAWEDEVLPLPGRATLSQPFVVASMLEALELGGEERVLDVGSGSGYTTALLCELCEEVCAIELEPDLVDSSCEKLASLGYDNFDVRAGNGWSGWPEDKMFDAIMISAAAKEVPGPLLDLLSPGGRLVAPIGPRSSQMLRLYRRSLDGSKFEETDLYGVSFVPLRRRR